MQCAVGGNDFVISENQLRAALFFRVLSQLLGFWFPLGQYMLHSKCPVPKTPMQGGKSLDQLMENQLVSS